MAKSFTPIFDRVLIKRKESSLERKTKNTGLVLPDQVKDAYQSSEGILVKVGEGCCDAIHALLGKEVLFAKYSGDDLKLNGEDFVLASELDIFGEMTNE